MNIRGEKPQEQCYHLEIGTLANRVVLVGKMVFALGHFEYVVLVAREARVMVDVHFPFYEGVLVSSGCYNKAPQLGNLNGKTYSSHRSGDQKFEKNYP